MHGRDNGGKGDFGLWLKAYQDDGLVDVKEVLGGPTVVTTVVRKRGQW